MIEAEILNTLDYSNDGFYCTFVELGHGYSYLIDTRLNIFRSGDGRWVIAIERVGYNPRAGSIILDIYYYGNCLINLESYNGRSTNYWSIYPIEENSFNATVDGESLNGAGEFWMISGRKISVSRNRTQYNEANIEIKESKPNQIGIEEAARLLTTIHPDLFRATDAQLYKSIPFDLNKILVLDEWYHRDFALQLSNGMTNGQIESTYNLTRNSLGSELNFDEFKRMIRNQEIMNNQYNANIWQSNRPSAYETWQQIARVILTNDTDSYKPSLSPNTHWSYWPDSGSL